MIEDRMSKNTTAQIRPAKKFGPGYFIREQMDLREWTQEDLAEVTGMTLKHINRIIMDKQALTLDKARILGEVFNTSAQYWINLDTGYRLWLDHEKTEKELEVDIRSEIYTHMPVRDMVKKGWLKNFKSTLELKDEVLRFWNWKNLDFSNLDKQELPCFTRKSSAYNQYNAYYALTWYKMALKLAETIPHKTYSKEKLEKLYDEIHVFTIEDNGIELFLNEFEKCGVIFFVLPHLQKTYLDGAAFISDKNPVIVYTGRYKRIDNFWFTIAHEIAHVLRHIDEQTPFILDNLKDGLRNDIEKEANALAAEKLKHLEISEFLDPHLGYMTTRRVEECADKYKIHPSIVIGKMAHDKKLSYRNLYLYNEDVLKIIPEKYLKLGGL